MFIEYKKSGKFLAKKSNGKIFLVKIDKDGITEKILDILTKKECDFIFESENFKKFDSEVYNNEKLKDVVFKSKFLGNNIEVLELLLKENPKIYEKSLKEKLSGEEILYKQGEFFKGWLDKSFPIQFIHNSNNIEGSKIPLEEVEKIIQNKKYIYKVKNEIQEVKNSKKAWDFLNEKFIFNEANIKKLYHILTKDLLQETGIPYPRGFKKIANTANNNATTEPENVVYEITNLLNKYKSNRKDIFPLQNSFDFHLKYEQIHPFENGNGRTGRLLMNKILLQNGMIPMIVFKENYKSYSNSIASCSSGSKRKYYKFMIEQYNKTLNEGYHFTLGYFEKINNEL